MSASGCGLNRPLAVLHEGQLWVESCRSRLAAFDPKQPLMAVCSRHMLRVFMEDSD